MDDSIEKALEALYSGKAPLNPEVYQKVTVGLEDLSGFIKKHYLDSYISEGGSKIKFVTGRPGSGKTHFAEGLLLDARKDNYLTVFFSAKEVWLNDFREVYLEILKQCDLEKVLKACADQIIRKMGYLPDEIPEGKNFIDLLSEKGEGDPISKGEIKTYLREFFIRNPILDNNFAGCCSLLTGGILGHPTLEEGSRQLILSFLHGDKSVKLAQLRSLGLTPSRITRYNARYLLRSLAEVAHLGGYAGIVVVIDDLEKLLDRSTDSRIRYTKLKRDDTYESIRQLVDDIDLMGNILFVFCFDRQLLDDESCGVKSYQALWFRIQNEVVSTRFNRFADIIDMDRYADEKYSEKEMRDMAEILYETLDSAGYQAHLPDDEDDDFDSVLAEIRQRSEFGGLGIPYLINRRVVEGDKKDV